MGTQQEKFQERISTLSATLTETVIRLSSFLTEWFYILLYFIFYTYVICIMAEVDKRHYNLRSGANTVQLPVQIHMSNDSDFTSKISQNDQNSDSNDSAASELDCTAIIESSDSEQTSGKESKQSTSQYTKYFVCWKCVVRCCHSTGNKRSNFSTAFIYQR